MFECTFQQGDLFKKIITALSTLVKEGNFMIDSEGLSFQGMDASHVSLCAVALRPKEFQEYRCDRNISLGMNLESMQKILKCMGSDDTLSLRHDEDTDVLLFIFEGPNKARISNFEVKLMDIDDEVLGIPETDYQATVKLPAPEFQRICKDMKDIGDVITIEVKKDDVTFAVKGQIGNGKVCIKAGVSTKEIKKKKSKAKGAKKKKSKGKKGKRKSKSKNKGEESSNGKQGDEVETDAEVEAETPGDVAVKPEPKDGDDEDIDVDGDEDMENRDEQNAQEEVVEQGDADADADTELQDKEEEESKSDDDNEGEKEKSPQPPVGNIDDDPDDQATIQLVEPLAQDFALSYLNNFTKATSLSKTVMLQMAPEVPLVCEYNLGEIGYVRFYLAPKIEDEE